MLLPTTKVKLALRLVPRVAMFIAGSRFCSSSRGKFAHNFQVPPVYHAYDNFVEVLHLTPLLPSHLNMSQWISSAITFQVIGRTFPLAVSELFGQ